MKTFFKSSLFVLFCFLLQSPLSAQGCYMPYKSATKDLTTSQQTLMSFVADADRIIFDIDAYRYTNSVATLMIFADGALKRTIAVRKGSFNTYFALTGLNGQYVEIKGHKGSPTNRRQVKITLKKTVTLFNRDGYRSLVSLREYTRNIPPLETVSFGSLGTCNGKARLSISFTGNNMANMVVRVRENGRQGRILHTYTLGGSTRNFVRYINSSENLHIEITNTNAHMRKNIRASVRYTNSSGILSVNN